MREYNGSNSIVVHLVVYRKQGKMRGTKDQVRLCKGMPPLLHPDPRTSHKPCH